MTVRWREGSVYLQVEKDTYISRLKVARATQTKPRAPLGGTLLIKLTIKVPDKAFDPLEPEAEVTIGEGFALPQPVEVEVNPPEDEAAS